MANSTARFGFALEYVSDINAARPFFVDVLGLAVDRDHPTFVQFKAQDGVSYAIASDEPMDKSGGPELWWLVDDAEGAFSEMSSGAEVSMPLREMPFGKVLRHQGSRRPGALSAGVRQRAPEPASVMLA